MSKTISICFIIALLVLAGTAFAGPTSLTESDMDKVSAEGLQLITNDSDVYDQNNNNGSVQLNDYAQFGVAGMAILNSSSSAHNIGQNVATADGTADVEISQKNIQYAYNYIYWDIQDISNYYTENQNNNNDSVQLNGYAQVDAAGMAIANIASSAVNIGQNVASVTGPNTSTISQSNNQLAINNTYSEQIVVNNVDPNQNNNNASVQLNDYAQYNAAGMVILNVAGSAVNVGQNVATVTGGIGTTITQSNNQTAINFKY